MTTPDLDAIPHPGDCYCVPVGATIPADTPFWIVYSDSEARWLPDGQNKDMTVLSEGRLYLTAEPIPAPAPVPTPEDSPIIASGFERYTKNHHGPVEDYPFKDVFLVWGNGAWRGWNKDGTKAYIVAPSHVTDWSPAIVTPTGHGVMDDRDKRDRRDRDGDVWSWSDSEQAWSVYGQDASRDVAGNMAVIAREYGPLTFADGEAER